MVYEASPHDSHPIAASNTPPASEDLLTGSQIPVPLTPFIGREKESTAAVALLGDPATRLLTLTGPGGAGKSRLAIHIATELAEGFDDGVIFVPLASVRDPYLVLPTICRAYGIAEGEKPVDQVLTDYLSNRNQLLVLDNFEQVVDAAPLIVMVLKNCPRLHILVTSQIGLRVEGEQQLAVPPMDLPPRASRGSWNIPPLEELAQYDAVALFIQQAHSVQPDFALTNDNALAVTEVCRRLDGLPLAIELAAARLKVLSPSALLTRLAEPFATLSSGPRDHPLRLQTMHAAISWSYDLLSFDEQRLIRRLAVFAGSFTLDAAEVIVQVDGTQIDAFEGISSLIDKSLLLLADSASSEPRYVMLQTIRDYGIKQLAELDEIETVRLRQADWCVTFVEALAPGLSGPDASQCFDRFEAEHDNIRAVLGWALDHDEIEIASRLVIGTWMFWFQRSYFIDGRLWLGRMIERCGHGSSSVISELFTLSSVFTQAGGEFQRALELAREGQRIAMEVNDRRALALSTFALADVTDSLHYYEEAELIYQQAAELFEKSGEYNWLSVAYAYLASLAHRRGEDERAEELVAQALSMARQQGFTWGIAMSLNRMGRFATDRGDFNLALELQHESLALWMQLGDRWRVTRVMVDLADSLSACGSLEQAVRLLGASDVHTELLAASSQFTDDLPRQRAFERTQSQLSDATFSAALAAGRGLSWAEALAEARSYHLPNREPELQAQSTVESAGSALTAREKDVLRLLAEGWADRRIANELFISPRTVQSHVAHIFTKLGVKSRTEAATLAVRNGLVLNE